MKSMRIFLMVSAAVLLFAARGINVVYGKAEPQRINIVAKRFSFEPAEATVKKGVPVVLVFQSPDVAHGIRFRDLNAEVKIPAKGTAELPITPDKTGDFVGHCSVFCGSGHGGMAFTLHVTE